MNACYNCVDRHLAQYRNKAALIFVSEVEGEPPYAMTYQELHVRVNEMVALLRDYCGLKAGDRVTLHLPMTLDLPHDAGVRAPWDHPLAGVRRILGAVLWFAHPGLR